jgi:flagellar biosynthetic protein FlhB
VAEETDQEKTEEPTGRKLEKARGEGNVAKSQEVSNWFAILSMAAITAFFLPSVAASFTDILAGIMMNAHDQSLDIAQLTETARNLLLSIITVVAVPAIIVFVAALASGLIQTQGFLFTAKSLKPELSKIGFKRGFSKVFSMNAVAEFLKGIIKIIIVTSVVIYFIWPDRDQITSLVGLDTVVFAEVLRREILKILAAIFVVMTLIVVVDVSFQRYQHRKKLRMTKQEVKDEHKNTEGDPQVKNRLRRIRIERSRQRIMAAVPQADVVVTNPTHYAVALKYDQEEMEAPRLTAKGADSLAFKIREVAQEYKVPIVENPPLARGLYGGVELEQQIPPEHYKAVAEVIGYVMRVHGKLRSERERERKAAAARRSRRAARDGGSESAPR